jgi:hypothetical protein
MTGVKSQGNVDMLINQLSGGANKQLYANRQGIKSLRNNNKSRNIYANN